MFDSMKTYTLKNDDGEITGFEIPNSFISSKSIARFIEKATGSEIISVRKMFSPSDVHVNFVYENIEFEVCEPFGDNSRLWVYPKDKLKSKAIQSLKRKVSEF